MIPPKFKLLFSVVSLFTFHPYFSQDDPRLHHSNNDTLYETHVSHESEVDIIEEKQDNSKNTKEELFKYVEEEAEFIGGFEEMKKYIQNNLKYPKIAIENKIAGKSYLGFIVNMDGSISDVVVARGIPGCPECDEEAIRLVKSMPNWIPAKHNGKVVRWGVHIPIEFKLP